MFNLFKKKSKWGEGQIIFLGHAAPEPSDGLLPAAAAVSFQTDVDT